MSRKGDEKIKEYTKSTRNKHLTWNDRMTMERMLKNGGRKKDVAVALDKSLSTIYYEYKRGLTLQRKSDLTEKYVYLADKGQKAYDESIATRNEKLRQSHLPKLKQDPVLISMIEYIIINEKASPQAALRILERDEAFEEVTIKSRNTIYSGIKKGYFPNLTYSKLPEGRHKTKNRHKVKIAKQATQGVSIEQRSDEVLSRNTAGHWEMDTVHGKSTNRVCLLTFTERKTRAEIVVKLKACTVDEVRKALNRIEKKYGSKFYEIFKTITVDNGSEFADHEVMQKALYRVGNRTIIFYCHARSPQERGTNEVANKMVRRFAPKGADFDKIISKSLVERINEWMNSYPREILGGKSSGEAFFEEFGFAI